MLNGCWCLSLYEFPEMLCFGLNRVGRIRDTALALLFDDFTMIGVAARIADRGWIGSDEIVSWKDGLAGGLGIRLCQHCLDYWSDREGRR